MTSPPGTTLTWLNNSSSDSSSVPTSEVNENIDDRLEADLEGDIDDLRLYIPESELFRLKLCREGRYEESLEAKEDVLENKSDIAILLVGDFDKFGMDEDLDRLGLSPDLYIILFPERGRLLVDKLNSLEVSPWIFSIFSVLDI